MTSDRSMRRRRIWSWGTAGAGVVVVPVLAALQHIGSVDGMLAVVGTVALGSVVVMTVGIAVNKPADGRPWRLVVASNAVSCVVVALWSTDIEVLRTFVAPALGFLPMILTSWAALHWLRRETGTKALRVSLDALLVAFGTAMSVWVAFVTTVIERTGNPFDASLLRVLCLVVDAAVLTVLVHLCIARGRANRAYPLLTIGMACVTVAHALLAIQPAYPGLTPSTACLYPLTIGFGFMVAATLHPTMADKPPWRPRRGDTFRQRFVVVLVVLTVSVVMTVLYPPVGQTDRLVRLALFALLFCAVLIRSEIAVGQSEKEEDRARHRATHDDLTNLPNRSALYDDLAAGGPHANMGCCLHFMDLNDFKLVNDSFGHRIGDELISLVATRVVAAVGDLGVVYRYGGDEFVVASWSFDDCPCVAEKEQRTETQAADPTIADRILAAMREPFELSVGRVFVSTSIGVSFSTPGAGPLNADDLIREADSAMYYVKATKPSGAAVFDDRLRSIALSELELTNAMREAVGRDQFELYYQPIVDLQNNEEIAYEALLRWHLQGRLVSPAEFIGLAESTDLIVEIGEWVLDSACAQLARWRRQQSTLRIAVNVSGRQLRGGGLLDTVKAALERNDLPGSALWLELTETALIEDHLSAREVLRELVALGVTICIDDFGTGYSALGNFQKFPIEIVKIDKSFIDAIDRDAHKVVLTSAIEALSRALGLATVAEGVETTEQEAQVRAIGCRYAQGWYFGRPVPAAAVVGGLALATPEC
ncbi:putative bifunctional diguanylate cyclase/phosphodiesterase [Antrihabitans sp. NCIMB 15449]|uniref:Bifunctional diguanylate cyclase/phosphodiesterase n=1 Tax=Antrihabitans spumae TaxID=3373370 RepID=A0ABW7JRJ5_9NOCA